MKHAIIALATMLLPVILPNPIYTSGMNRKDVADYFKPSPATSVSRSVHIERVIAIEGGYQNCRYDKGNAGVGTKYGITPATYKRHKGYKPNVSQMKALSKQEAAKIYTKIWEDSGMNSLPEQVAGEVFDAYVNMPQTALQIIEKITAVKGCATSFRIDEATASAIRKIPPEVFKRSFKEARKQYYLFRAGKYNKSHWHKYYQRLGKSGSSGNTRYLNGWLSRLENLEC